MHLLKQYQEKKTPTQKKIRHGVTYYINQPTPVSDCNGKNTQFFSIATEKDASFCMALHHPFLDISKHQGNNKKKTLYASQVLLATSYRRNTIQKKNDTKTSKKKKTASDDTLKHEQTTTKKEK